MANMRMDKNPMPEQDPVVAPATLRRSLSATLPEMAMDEAKRCLNCHNMPSPHRLPRFGTHPEFIAKVAEGDFDAAYEIITSTNSPARSLRPCLPAGEAVRI